MKKLSDLDYLKLNKFQAFLYKLKLFFCAIPIWFKNLGLKILNFYQVKKSKMLKNKMAFKVSTGAVEMS